MKRAYPVMIFAAVLGGFLTFVSAQPQQGGNPPPQNQPPAGDQPPSNGGTQQAPPPPPSQNGPQQGGQPGQMRPDGECRNEFEKACPGMHPGDGKWGPCVTSKDNIETYSDKCK